MSGNAECPFPSFVLFSHRRLRKEMLPQIERGSVTPEKGQSLWSHLDAGSGFRNGEDLPRDNTAVWPFTLHSSHHN